MKILKISTYLICMLLFTGCSIVSTNNINTVTDEIIPVQTDFIEEIEEAYTPPIMNFNKIDTSNFEIATNNEYSFKYNQDIWSEIDPYEYNQQSVDVNTMLANDVAKIIGSNITYLSNTTAQDYIDLIIASIPSIPLTGVSILDYNIETVGSYEVAIIETKAGFTKDDINELIYDQLITHENVQAIGGINYLDYRPILSQFLLVVCDDNKAYTFASAFENNTNSQIYNNYYKSIILDAFDSIVQTITTDIRQADF